MLRSRVWPAACAMRLYWWHSLARAHSHIDDTERVVVRMESRRCAEPSGNRSIGAEHNAAACNAKRTNGTMLSVVCAHTNTHMNATVGVALPSKLRTQFSISRIGFGLTFRWICVYLMAPYTHSARNNRIFSSSTIYALFFGVFSTTDVSSVATVVDHSVEGEN